MRSGFFFALTGFFEVFGRAESELVGCPVVLDFGPFCVLEFFWLPDLLPDRKSSVSASWPVKRRTPLPSHFDPSGRSFERSRARAVHRIIAELTFASLGAARAAAMHGRWFAGRAVNLCRPQRIDHPDRCSRHSPNGSASWSNSVRCGAGATIGKPLQLLALNRDDSRVPNALGKATRSRTSEFPQVRVCGRSPTPVSAESYAGPGEIR